jgi:DNA repair exonuclease SbcCD ATPase subunit
MIRYLSLSNWRTFGQLEFHLEPGTTFIVAENGVGKTSLVQGAAWALFGRCAKIDPRRAIRKGADTAMATVELELPDQTSLRIRRSIGKTETVEATHDEQTLGAEALDRLLADRFGADLDYLARITVLPGDTLADQAEESFQLQRHLCQMFGVEDLQRAADAAAQLHKRLDIENRKLRTVVRRADTDARALQARLDAARRTVAKLEERCDPRAACRTALPGNAGRAGAERAPAGDGTIGDGARPLPAGSSVRCGCRVPCHYRLTNSQHQDRAAR